MESMTVSHQGPSTGDFQLHWSHDAGGDPCSAAPSPAEYFEDRGSARTLLLVMYVLLSPRCGAALDLLTPASVSVCLRVLSDSLSRQSPTDGKPGDKLPPTMGSRETAESTDTVRKEAPVSASGAGGSGYGKRLRQSTDWLSFGKPGSPAIKRARSLPAEPSGSGSAGSSAFDWVDDGPCKPQADAVLPTAAVGPGAAARRLSSSSAAAWNAVVVRDGVGDGNGDQPSFADQAGSVFVAVPPYGPCAALLLAHAPLHSAEEGKESADARLCGETLREAPSDGWADLALFLLHRLVAVDEDSEAAAAAHGDEAGSASSGRRFELALAERVRATRLAALTQRLPWPRAAAGAAASKAAAAPSASGSSLLCAVIARALPSVVPDVAVCTDGTGSVSWQTHAQRLHVSRLQAALLVAEDLSLVAAAASESTIPSSAAAASAAAGGGGASSAHVVEFLTAAPAGLPAAAAPADSGRPSSMAAVLLQAAEQLFEAVRRPGGGTSSAASSIGAAAVAAGGAAAGAAGTLCELWHSCLRVLVNCSNNSVRGAELLLDARAPSRPSTPRAKPATTARGELCALSLLSPACGTRAPEPPLFSHIGSALEWARGTLSAAGACSSARAQAFDSAVLCLGLLGNSVEHSERAQALLLSASSAASSSAPSSASSASCTGRPRALLSATARAATAGAAGPGSLAAVAAAAAPLAEQPQPLLALVGSIFAEHHSALQAGLEESGSSSSSAGTAAAADAGCGTGIGHGGSRPSTEPHPHPQVNDSVVIAAYAALVLAAVLPAPGAPEDAAAAVAGAVPAPRRAAIVLDAVAAAALAPPQLSRAARASAAATTTPSVPDAAHRAGAAAAALLFVLRAFARLQSEAGVLTAEMAAHLAGAEARIDAAAASYAASAQGPAPAAVALLPLSQLPARVGTAAAAGAAADSWADAAHASSARRAGGGVADGGCRGSPARASPCARQSQGTGSASPAAAAAAASSGRRALSSGGIGPCAALPPLPTSAARIAAARAADGAAGESAAGSSGGSSSARSTGSSVGGRTPTRASAATPPLQRSASAAGSPARRVPLLAASQGRAVRLPSSPARAISAPLDVGSPLPLQPVAK